MYPAGSPPKADNWTTDTFLKAAEACHKGGVPVRHRSRRDHRQRRYRRRDLPVVRRRTRRRQGQSHGQDRRGAPGARILQEADRRSCRRTSPAWDDASNNKWLVSGKGAMIMNPPSAWAVAKRDAPQVAEQCWTHGFPAGPKGRFAPFLPYFWSIWNFSKNKEAAKSLLVHLSQPASIEKMVDGERRLRPAGLREADDAEDLGRGRAAEGHALSLSQPVQASDPVDRGLAGAAQDRPADLCAGHADQDVPALLPGRGDGEDARLGRRRVRRLHAELSARCRRGGPRVGAAAAAHRVCVSAIGAGRMPARRTSEARRMNRARKMHHG